MLFALGENADTTMLWLVLGRNYVWKRNCLGGVDQPDGVRAFVLMSLPGGTPQKNADTIMFFLFLQENVDTAVFLLGFETKR